MKKNILSILTLSLICTSGLLHGQYIALNGASTVTNNLIAISSNATIASFYSYSSNEYNGSLALADFSINTFIYQQNPSGPLSFVTVFGEDPTILGGGDPHIVHTAYSEVTLEGTTASFSIKDDADTNDNYTENGSFFTADTLWWEQKTDGYAITDINGFSKLIQSVDPDNSYQTWYLHSGNGDGPFTLDIDSNLVITPVPEPSTIGLMVLAGLPLALFIRRRFARK